MADVASSTACERSSEKANAVTLKLKTTLTLLIAPLFALPIKGTEHGVVPSTVALSDVCVAATFLKKEIDLFDELLAKCRKDKPTFGGEVLKWDEAKLTVCSPIFKDVVKKLCSTALGWSMCIHRRVVLIGWPSGDISWLPIITPPMAMLEANANTLHDVLLDMPRMAALQKLIDDILAECEERGHIHSGDGAGYNLKFTAYRFEKKEAAEPNRDLMASVYCGSHRENLVEVAVISASVTTAELSLLWSGSIFRSGSFYLRVIVTVKWWLLKGDNLVVIHGEPPPHARRLAKETLDFITVNYRQFEKAYLDKDDEKRGADRRRRKYLVLKAWAEFFEEWNGVFAARGRVHKYEPRDSTRTKSAIATSMSSKFVAAPLRSNPTDPELGKWTKMGASIDFHCMADMPHGIVSPVLHEALDNYRDQLKDASDDPIIEGMSGEELDKLHWHKMHGVKLDKLLQLHDGDAVAGPISKFRRLQVVHEPLRFVTCFYLKCTRRTPDPCKVTPSICDAINPNFSPTVTVQQYLHMLGTGRGDRLRFIWQLLGYDCFRSWASDHPHAADELLAMIQAGSCLTWRYHDLRLEAPEFQFACLGDTRPPLGGDGAGQDRPAQYAKRIHTSTQCCLGRFGGTLAKRSASQEVLRGPKWRHVSLLWSKLLEHALSIGDLERGNHLTNQLVTSKMSLLESVMDRHINIDAKIEFNSVRLHAASNYECKAIGDSVVAVADASSSALVPVAAAPPPARKRRRAQNALWHFRKNLPANVLVDVMHHLGKGKTANQFTPEFHDAVTKAWNSLSPEDAAHYETLALMDKMRVRAANAQDAAPAQPAPLTLPGPPAPAPLPLRDEEMPAEDAIVPADVLDSHADPRFQIARIDPTANNVLCRLVLAKDCRLCSRPPQTHALLNEVSFAAHLALPPRPPGEDTLVASEAPPMAITEYIRQNEVAGERPQPLHLAVYEAQRKSKTKTAMKESFNEFAVFVAKDRHVISGRVEYDDACDTRCCFVADTHRIRCVSVRCVDILARVVAGLKQSGVDYSRVGLSSKLVLVECKWAASESSAVTIDMYMLRNATGRSGRTKATQTFIGYKDTFNVATLSPHLDVVPEVDGMIATPLETAYTPQTECPSHFDPHNTGAYMHFTEKHVANAICDRFRHVINKELDYASVTFLRLDKRSV